MRVKVFKFGGASIKDADGFRQVGKIMETFIEDRIVIVVSALGKTTNAIEQVVNSMFSGKADTAKWVGQVKNTHVQIMDDLFAKHPETLSKVEVAFAQLFEAFTDAIGRFEGADYDYAYDQIVPYGELFSSKILSHYLEAIHVHNTWIDIRQVISTDMTYRDARIMWEATQQQVESVLKPMIPNCKRMVTQGFVGRTSQNTMTTLGREGSDYTAAILTYCLDAESMHIWKDVPGVLTGDPRVFNDVMLLPRLSYKEAIEMTYYGAKVIHPKTIKPIQNKQIPLYVRPYADPKSLGTLISDEKELTYPPIVVIEPGQALLHISTNDFSFVAEHHLSRIFMLLAKYRLKVNMMRNTAISFSVCVGQIEDRIQGFVEELGDEFKVVIDRSLELITIMHYNNDFLEEMKHNKLILFEEKLPEIVQLVVRNLPKMTRKEHGDQ
ncbi:MAG: aspartate kinase [Chitinophagales bacterium]|nr:aspartate kinase [Chitinophagales bacterium]